MHNIYLRLRPRKTSHLLCNCTLFWRSGSGKPSIKLGRVIVYFGATECIVNTCGYGRKRPAIYCAIALCFGGMEAINQGESLGRAAIYSSCPILIPPMLTRTVPSNQPNSNIPTTNIFLQGLGLDRRT